MKLVLLFGMFLFGWPLAAVFAQQAEAPPRVAIETSKGTIVVELATVEAPETTESFLDNVGSGYYDGTVFHRVIDGFMIQGGGFGSDLELKATDKALVNEADNGLKNTRGTIAMARRPDPHSASTQFFINLVDNPYLDHTSKSDQGWGYAVFGRVIEGMDVVDAIGSVETGSVGGMQNVPLEPVVVEETMVIE